MAKGIQINDRFPGFRLMDQDSKEIDLADHLGKPLVVYFYPKDDTPGCTKEACSFRDQYEFFTDVGATVFGISNDSPKSHRDFKEKYNLPFSLLSDDGNTFRKKVGVPSTFLGLIPGRVTYILDEKGFVKQIFNSQMNVTGHVTEAIATIKSLQEA
jgi:peroxiredoxin Q/BCP